MYVKMLRSLVTPAETFAAGRVYDVGPSLAKRWEEEGKALPTDECPPAIKTLQQRLEHGAGRSCLFLPPAGMEFGHEVMTHLRIVHFHKASYKVVCCRSGNEVLYPSADAFVTDWHDPIPDEYRVGTVRSRQVSFPDLQQRFPSLTAIPAGGLTNEEALCCISPDQRILFTPKIRGIRSDVVLGIRQRKFWTARNWSHWQWVADRLRKKGITYSVIGTKETSQTLVGQQHHSGDYDTDAAIELLRGCSLYVSTDCGASHLAATVGVPMLLFRESESGSPDLIPRMQMVNPHSIQRIDGWDHPGEVVRGTLEFLGK